ncbi:testis-specific zinc finger protein topi-like isoform X1 [Uranotaenia lowii]|uniref:testis-specific zinc finger protein topi-like isoform X1 n=1 Tax=Uranotaenia lowii TaxID=190385 RepID=UPI00247A2BE6|nr:testis-specific zinc finger protein topi-like isoform X1 [Uranotaenia lowii]
MMAAEFPAEGEILHQMTGGDPSSSPIKRKSLSEEQPAAVGEFGFDSVTSTDAGCQIKCANCDQIFTPEQFDEHVCEYDESKKRIEPGHILEGHPCFRQLEENIEQWKKLIKKSVGRPASNPGGTGERDRRKKGKDDLRELHPCSYCDRRFVHESGLSKHLGRCHPDKLEPVTKQPKVQHSKKEQSGEPFKVCLKCTKCGLIFSTVDKLMEHMDKVDWEGELEKSDGIYMQDAKLCLRMSIRVVILTTIFQCEFCSKFFSDLPSLYQHEAKHDPTSGYECTLCEIKIHSVKDIIFHRLNECVFRESWNKEFKSLSTYFACNVCDEQFESLLTLYEHRYANFHLFPRMSRIDETETVPTLKVGCELCSVSFDNAEAVFSHHNDMHVPKKSTTIGMRRQTNTDKSKSTASDSPCSSTRPYLCELCGKTYTQSSHLWQHLRFHNGIRPFTCPEVGCNRSFTIRPDLKDHIRKCHTGERPYHCTQCDKRFLTGSVYYQHRLIHRGERRYGCDECGKRFYRADALKNHQRIHSGEKPYACMHCPKQFRQRGDREKHIRVKHSVGEFSSVQIGGALYEGTPVSSRARGKRQSGTGGQARAVTKQRQHVTAFGTSRRRLSEDSMLANDSSMDFAEEGALPASLFEPILHDIEML